MGSHRSTADSLGGSATFQLTNPGDFEAIFNLLGPNQTRKLKLQVPDTVFLASNSDYVAVTSIVTTKSDTVHKWHPKKLTMKSMWELAQKWAARAETEHQPVAIARYLDACYLLNAQLLDDLIQKITGDKVGILAESDGAPDQLDVSSMELKTRPGNFVGGIPFCIQAYTPPSRDKRLVTSFQWSDISVVCESYITAFSDTYTPMKSMVTMREAKNREGKELEKKQRVKLQLADMDSNRLRQMTLAIVNYIHRAHKFQLLGLVVEIVEDKDGCLWLNAILGSCWPEEWARRNVLRPDGFMAVDMPASVKATIMGKKIHPGSFAPGDLTRSTVPPRNSDRNTKGHGHIIVDSGSVPAAGNGIVRHRETWHSSRSDKSQVSITKDWIDDEKDRSEMKAKMKASPRKVRLKPHMEDGGDGLDQGFSANMVPLLPIEKVTRDDLMHISSSTRRAQKNRSFLYRSGVAESDPGALSPKLGALDEQPQSLHDSLTERDDFKASKPGGKYGLNSDVAMMLSPRYTQEGIWSSRSGIHSGSPAHSALAASGAVLTSIGKVPPSFGLSHSADRTPGKDQGRSQGDITARLTRRVEELRQALQEQSQEASAARVMELHSAAKQKGAERECELALSKLTTLERQFNDYRDKAFHEMQDLRRENTKAVADAAHLQAKLRETTVNYEAAKSRLHKEREVAFEITTDLKDELLSVKTELGNIRCNMQGELSNSESNRDFAESELQEERARARSLGKQVKVLEDAKDQLEKDLRDENDKRRKLQFDKDTILRCMPELHIVMKTMLEGQFAQISWRDMQNLLPSPDFDVDVEHSNINRILGSNSITVRQIFQYYAGATGPASRRGKLLSSGDFVRLCRDIGLMESQLDKARSMSVLAAAADGNWSKAKKMVMRRMSLRQAPPPFRGKDSAPSPTATPKSPGSDSAAAASGPPASPTKDDWLMDAENELGTDSASEIMSMVAETYELEDIGEMKSLEVKHLKTLDAEHIFTICISEKGGKKENERSMELQGFAHALVRIAVIRYPRIPTLSSRVLALWFQCLYSGAKRVDLQALLNNDRETKRSMGMSSGGFDPLAGIGSPPSPPRPARKKGTGKSHSPHHRKKHHGSSPRHESPARSRKSLNLGFEGDDSSIKETLPKVQTSAKEASEFLQGLGVAVPSHISLAATESSSSVPQPAQQASDGK